MSELVTIEDAGRVRTVTMNRPEKRNALNPEMIVGLADAFSHAADDPSVNCLVLRGAGPMFSSGVDVLALGSVAQDVGLLRPFRREILECFNHLERMTKPTVAAIQGGCLGAAMEMVLACDLRVMADDAMMAIPEVRLGLLPDVGGCSRLPAVVGLGRAKDLIMTGRAVAAQEAFDMGLVNRLAPAKDLDQCVDALTEELLANAPLAVGRAKGLMDMAAKPALAATLAAEVTAQEVLITTEDFAEACRAFLERRQPEFSGR